MAENDQLDLFDEKDTDPDSVEESEDDAEDSGESDPLDGQEDLQKTLIDLYDDCKSENRYARLVEVKDVKRAEFYWGGKQYIWWSQTDQCYNLPTQQANNYGDMDIDDMPRFEFVTNIYQARGLMVIAAVAGAPPRIRFFPNDADDENDLETAENRTKLARLIQRWNPQQQMLQEETYNAWTGGYIAWWTRYADDNEKYGIDSVQLLSQGEDKPENTINCPKCGWSAPANEAVPPVPCPSCSEPLTEDDITEEEPIPVPQDEKKKDIPKGRQIISVFGALNCSRPQHVSNQAGYHYFGLEDEVHYSTLRAAFQDKADDIKPGLSQGSDDVFERNARLSVSENSKLYTQTGGNQANLCTFVRAWFRPTAFWMIKDKTKRDKLIELFPRGVRVEFTGNVYCKCEAESMDDCIVTAHAMPGRGQHRPAIGDSMLSVQDRVNTFANIEAETYEYGIPITYRASDTWNAEADDEQRAAPGLEVECFLRPGENLQQRIIQMRADSVSPTMAAHTTELVGPLSDQLTGTYPGVTGAGGEEGAPQTVGQQAMQRDSGMGRMGIFYVNLKQAHADVMTLSCRNFEAHASGSVKIPVLSDSGDFESESIDVTALEGEAEAFPEGDENFPETWTQQRQTMMGIADSPYGAELIKDPENAELFLKLTGIPDLKSPSRGSWRKQLKEIAQLTKIPDDEGLLTGIAPMVEVDPVTDNHPVEISCCMWWLNDEKGQKIKMENPAGWQAVKEHMQQHQQAIPKPEPQGPKPLSPTMTTAYKDLPPEAQAQWLEKEFGIQVSPQDFMQQVALEQAKKKPAIKPAPGMPHQAVPPNAGEPANAAVGGM
jgi:hypothetical protein